MAEPSLNRAELDGRRWVWHEGGWLEHDCQRGGFRHSGQPPDTAHFFNHKQWALSHLRR
jgi:hypothetical protein